jgi:TfoX/Sxy family transcriptional regulator of competence genes
MHWRKSPQELIDTFEAAVPPAPAVLRKMFGYPAGFVNGNMFTGLHQENMIVRLSEPSRDKFLKTAGARIFEPMPGRPMREYVILPASVIQDKDQLRFWVAQALEYGLTLKPKAAGKSTGKSPGKNKRTAR